MLSVYVAIGPEKIHTIIARRVFSMDNFKSDELRIMQVNALLSEYENALFVGKGLGGYAHENIRDRTLLHSYEVQWVAFLMQFGFIGVLILLVPLFVIVFRLIKGKISRIKWSFCGLFLLWLLSGFTNPFLISLTSGIIYALFLVSADLIDESYNQSVTSVSPSD